MKWKVVSLSVRIHYASDGTPVQNEVSTMRNESSSVGDDNQMNKPFFIPCLRAPDIKS